MVNRDLLEELTQRIKPKSDDSRFLLAIAGPPASGKSTAAASLVHDLNSRGLPSALLAMDGFHLDNTILEQRGLLERKGAPETFDVAGFKTLVERIVSEDTVYVPTFDRERDLAIAASEVIEPEHRIVVVEGNYLLFDQAPWNELAKFWDEAIFFDVRIEVIRERLIQRWLDHGLSEEDAIARVERNDLPNARLVFEKKPLAGSLVVQAHHSNGQIGLIG